MAGELKPFLDLTKMLYLENIALRDVLSHYDDWDDDTVNSKKENHREAVEKLFSQLESLSNNPDALGKVVSALKQFRPTDS